MNQIVKHQPPDHLPPTSKFCADCNMVFYAEHLACPGCDKPIPPAPPIAQILNSGHPSAGKIELTYTGAEVAKLMNCPPFEKVERVILRIPPSLIAKTFIRKGFEQNRQKAAGPDEPAEQSSEVKRSSGPGLRPAYDEPIRLRLVCQQGWTTFTYNVLNKMAVDGRLVAWKVGKNWITTLDNIHRAFLPKQAPAEQPVNSQDGDRFGLARKATKRR